MRSLKGPDGITSGRKVAAFISFLVGLACELYAQFVGVDSWFDLAPGAACFVFSGLLWGFVTVQAIKGVIKK